MGKVGRREGGYGLLWCPKPVVFEAGAKSSGFMLGSEALEDMAR